METYLPLAGLVLAAVGGAVLVVARTDSASLLALGVLWLGLIAGAAQDPGASSFALRRGSVVEAITAAASIGVLAITLRGLRNLKSEEPAGSISQFVLPSATALLAGLAGVGFAALFPLGETESNLVFYWAMMAGALTLVLDGTRSPVKLAAGLLALLNAACLLVYTLDITPPGPALLGLMAMTRLALAVAMAYGWLLVVDMFGSLNLNPLFTARDGLSTALAVAGRAEPDSDPSPIDSVAPEPDSQPDE
jgi:hypothetical protein